MVNLAIKGHPTRGKEVIQLLEMLGVKNLHDYTADCDGLCFYISKGTNIYYDWVNSCCEDVIVYTLEEFEEKFPYKVEDKVAYKFIRNYIIDTIKSMKWYANGVVYTLKGCEDEVMAEDLQPYKKETMEEPDEPKAPILSNRYDYAEGKCGYVIPDGYEFDYIKEGFQTEIILKPKKSQYPKNYEECCDVLGYEPDEDEISCYQGHLIELFVKLLICRDAYWKMGLGKPWKPDWNDVCDKYTIYVVCGNEIWRDKGQTINTLLAFPTPEMRDAFYENFKELIEQCKELL